MSVVQLVASEQPAKPVTQKIRIKLVVPLSGLLPALATVDQFLSSKEDAEVTITLNILPG